MSEPDVERLSSAPSARGELVLRRRGQVLELISNGTFLMDTAGGASERALADLALARARQRSRVLVAGLGFGFTLAAALQHDVAAVVVVELEPVIVEWNTRWWPLGRDALGDPRVSIVIEDFAAYARSTADTFDAVLVDIDNGPEWTVAAPNSDLYDGGLPDLRRLVRRPQGRLGVWSADRSPRFERRLGELFGTVAMHELAVPRGQPDVV